MEDYQVQYTKTFFDTQKTLQVERTSLVRQTAQNLSGGSD